MFLPKLTVRRQEWRTEMVGILFLGCAIFFLMALCSYSPLDPSLNHSLGGEVDIANLGGRIGALVADLLLQGVGLGAFILPLYLVAVFIGMVSAKNYPPWSSVGGVVLLILCTAIWSSLLLPVWVVQKTEVLTGGFFGEIVGEYLVTLFNPIGTYLLMSVFFALALIVTTHISPLRIAALLVASLLACARQLLQAGRRLSSLLANLGRRKPKAAVESELDSPES